MRTNWSGTVDFTSSLALPTRADEVQELMRTHDRVLAIGSAHSFSRAAVGPGLHIGTAELEGGIDIAPDRTCVTVPAGIRYAELGTALYEQGLALAAMASLPHISVGGAVATGTHGSGDAIGTLSSAVTALEVVTPDGNLRWVRRDTDDDFAGWVVALGALGVVTRVTLAVEPAYDITQSVLVGLDLDVVEERFDEVFGAATSVSVFTRWRPEPDAQLWLKRRLDREGAWPGAPDFGARPSARKMHPLEDLDPVHCTEQGISGPWHERLPHFKAEFTPSSGDEIQAEYLLPRANAVQGIRAVRGLAARITPLLHVTEIRTMRADDLWLSPAYGRDTVGIHFTWHKDECIFDVLPAIEEALLPLGARPHWGKVTLATPDQLVAAYPRFGDFHHLVDALDPSGRCRSVVVDALMTA